MRILGLNSGSATLKFQLFETGAAGLQSAAQGCIEKFDNYAQATLNAFAQLSRLSGETWVESLTAVGHRIVHGGERFVMPTRITPQVLREIESLSALAPLHNPPALEVIRAVRDKLGDSVPMYAMFDTAFHHDLPDEAKHYALPAAWTRDYSIRRYGFHGIAHRYLYERYAELTGKRAERVITLQLGQGCSMSALHNGRPVDTSMGYTPLERLIMATRPGDVDAGMLLGGADAILFGGGIGAQNSTTDIHVIPVNEELLIAREVRDHLAAGGAATS